MKPQGIIASWLLAALLLAANPASAAAQLSELFGFAYPDGNDPSYLIQASDGNLYGTTYLGGGTVFKLTPSGQFTLLFTAPYDPSGTNHYPDGESYGGLVEGPDGLLYVIAHSGNNGQGTLFRISKSGADFQVVLQSAPGSFSLASDGNFYGVAAGKIFRLTTSGTYTVLSSPNGFTSFGFGKQATDGNFYGICTATAGSGPPHICRVTTSGQVTSIFQFPQARWPANGILTPASNGFLYGSALVNPNSNSFQVIFQLSTSGNYQELYQTPIQCCVKIGYSMVVLASDGNLWVTNPNMQYAGSVYSITTTGTLLQTVTFPLYGATGSFPHYLIQASNGILYGATYEYGKTASGGNATGTIFSINAGLPQP